MRYVCCTMAVSLLCGCQGNSTTLRNPFATPNRVPPPATRVLQPGAAQPYYPGDTLPTTPAVGGAVLPPGSIGAPVPGYQPTPGSVPPGGWNSSPQSNVTPTTSVVPVSAQIPLGPLASGNEPPVQVNADQQNLRFTPSPAQEFGPGIWNPPQAATPTTQAAGQLVLPPNPSAQFAAQPAGFSAPTAASQFANQSQLVQNTANAEPRKVRIRAVKSPRTDSGSGSRGEVSRDGFRPQGSRLINRSSPERRGSALKPGTAPSQFGPPTRENPNRFGFDPQYEWLRGQLQVSQVTGQWHLRYVPAAGTADQFGGQVLIENPHLLGGLQPGDFVQVRGRLTRQPNGVGLYTVSIVQRQRVQ